MQKLLVFLALIAISFGLNAQVRDELRSQLSERGEVYISVETSIAESNKSSLRAFSFDKIDDGRIYFYGNKNAFASISSKSINYRIEPIPSQLFDVAMLPNAKAFTTQWDAYPTYEQYDSIMHKFAIDYPNLCKIHNFGNLYSGRKLLCLQLGDSVNVNQNEVKFLYTATMHGDETAGYLTLLRLAEYLLQNYNTDPQATYIMNNVDIWLNPLANPDGTYHTGNSSVNGATRYNMNSIDLNRNYPDPEDGIHPDGNIYQQETDKFMKLADSVGFTMAANIHGGAEVVNYPWDTWSQLPADDDWWVYVSKMYADTAHANSPANYLTKFGTGYVNGYQWYSVWGGRQDYMNYFQHCREFVLELSNTKLLAESDLRNHWDYNYKSLLNYMEQSTYGINGRVTDSLTGLPLKAMVEIVNHDEDSSMVFSNANGYYFRPIFTGTYSVKYTADGYYPKIINNVSTLNGTAISRNVQLSASADCVCYLDENNSVDIYPNPISDKINIESSKKLQLIEIFDISGKKLIGMSINSYMQVVDVSGLSSGVYLLKLQMENSIVIEKIIKP